MQIRYPASLAAVLALLVSNSGFAAECSGFLESDEIVRCLQRPLTRGLPVIGRTNPEPAPTVRLQVNFAFNSSRLTNQGTAALDRLGLALIDPALHSARFEIAGHTDAVGSDEFNLRLSEARAATVRDYLVRRFDIGGDRLATVGSGRTRLYDPAHPASGVNRRVQITNLGE